MLETGDRERHTQHSREEDSSRDKDRDTRRRGTEIRTEKDTETENTDIRRPSEIPQHFDLERDENPETDSARLGERWFKRQKWTLYETERHKEPEIRQTDKIIQRHMPRDSEEERQMT